MVKYLDNAETLLRRGYDGKGSSFKEFYRARN